jgi:hypothetical protein
MAITRIKSNQISTGAVQASNIADATITGAKLVNNLTYGSNLTVSGNLIVSGTTSTIDTTNTTVADPYIMLSSGASGSPTVDGGIIINRGASANATFFWDESADKFTFGTTTDDGTTAGNITLAATATIVADTLEGNVTGDLTGNSVGTHDGVIGGNTPAAITGTVITANTSFAGALNGTVGATTPATIVGTTITANTNFAGDLTGDVTGAVDGVIGGNTPAAVTGTTITANTGFVGALNGIIGGSTPAAVTGTTITANTSFVGAIDGIVGGNTPAAGTFTNLAADGTITMTSNAITNVADPSNAQDAATKAYVDAQVSGSDSKIFQLNSNVEVTDTGTNGNIAFNIDGSLEGNIDSSGLTMGNINIDGNTIKTTSGNLTIDPTPDGSGGTLTIQGNLAVTGTTTTVDSTTVSIADPVFELGDDSSDDNLDRGIKMKYNSGGAKIAFMGYDDSATEFVVISDATDTSSVFSGSLGALAAGSLRVTDLTNGDIPVIGANGEFADGPAYDGTAITANLTGDVTGATAGAHTGAVDGIVGGNTPAAVTGTVITANTNFAGNLTGNVTGTQDGVVGGNTPAAVTGTVITANTNFAGDLTGDVTGAVDGVVGGNTPAAVTGTVITANTNFAGSLTAGSGKTIDVSAGTLTLADDQISGDKVAGGTISTFASTGIDDNATGTKLTISDASVAASAAITAATGIFGSTTASTDVTLKVDSTDSMMLPVGSTGQRPSTGITGMFRFNSTTGSLEVYTGSEWNTSTDFTVITADTFAGDGSTVAFTLSDTGTTSTTMVAINGVLQIPTTAYAVSGTTLTFTGAPESGDAIDARVLTTTSTIVAIGDDDGDTQIKVEEGSDDDTIRFDAAGSEIFTITSAGLAGASGARITAILDEDNMATNSDTAAATQQSIKAYVDSQVTASDLDFQGDSGGALSIDLDAETLDIAGGTGIDTAGSGNTLTVAIDSTVATLAGSQTLTNKTLTSAVLNTAVSGTAILDEDAMGSDSATQLATQQSIKAYVDSKVNKDITMQDADGDTKVQVEEGSDDDTIRFDAAGNYVACIESTGVDIKGNYTLTLGGILDANAKRLTNAADPTSAQDAATKAYVDAELSGLSQNSISQNNTNVTVTDSGTGSIVNTIDGSVHTTFNAAGLSLATGVFSGTATSAQYADLAEMYSADGEIAPGTIVMFGGEAEVTMCDDDHCKKVAGVVSTNPAYLMNSDAEGVAVALQGRVPCKVMGSVSKGDMMVSAGNGMARAEENPMMGAVIGKALADHEGGEGIIEVVVGRM